MDYKIVRYSYRKNLRKYDHISIKKICNIYIPATIIAKTWCLECLIMQLKQEYNEKGKFHHLIEILVDSEDDKKERAYETKTIIRFLEILCRYLSKGYQVTGYLAYEMTMLLVFLFYETTLHTIIGDKDLIHQRYPYCDKDMLEIAVNICKSLNGYIEDTKKFEYHDMLRALLIPKKYNKDDFWDYHKLSFVYYARSYHAQTIKCYYKKYKSRKLLYVKLLCARLNLGFIKNKVCKYLYV